MKILNESIENLKHEDIISFCKEGYPEGTQIDYKKDFPQKGFAKHFASFSNTRGGLIIIGVEEDRKTGVPIAWEGVAKDAKQIEKIHQEACNVEPIPSYEIHTSDEVEGKCFVLIRIFEGDKTPYYVQNDSNVWVRTGNVSNPVDIASPDGLELLFGKNDKAEKLRNLYISRVKNVYTSGMELEEKKRLRLVEEASKKGDGSESNYLQHKVGENVKMCTMIVQPYFPKKSLAKPSQIKEKIGEIRSGEFPDYNMKPIPEGIFHTAHGYNGYVECQQIYSQGLISHSFDISRVNEGVVYIPIFAIAGRLFRLLTVARSFYSKFGYQGSLEGFVELEDAKGVHFKEIQSNRYIFRDDVRESLLEKYKWEIKLDTHILQDEKLLMEWFMNFLEGVYWDLGFDSFIPDIVSGFLKENGYTS